MPEVSQGRKTEQAANLDQVVGFKSVRPRPSQTTAEGALRIDPIEGVRYRLTRPILHKHGHLVESFRADWEISEAPIV